MTDLQWIETLWTMANAITVFAVVQGLAFGYVLGKDEMKARQIVGPSMAVLNGASGEENNYTNTGKFLTVSSFLDHAKANNVMPDVLTVYTFDKDVVSGRLTEVQNLINAKGITNLAIGVNEYVAEHERTRLGVLPHYIAKMQAAGVQYGVHAT